MTCGNPIKLNLQKVVENWLYMFSVERKLSDYQMECMQFGICDYAPRKVEYVPFFITNYSNYTTCQTQNCNNG